MQQNKQSTLKSLSNLSDFFAFDKIEKNYKFFIEQNSFNNIEFKTYGCNNLFLVMKEDIFDGSEVTKKDSFRLKHLVSDTYFDLGYYKETKEKMDQVSFEGNKKEKVRYN